MEPAKCIGNGKGQKGFFQVPGVQAVFSVPIELVIREETPKEKRARVTSMRNEQANVIVTRISDEEAEQIVLRDLVTTTGESVSGPWVRERVRERWEAFTTGFFGQVAEGITPPRDPGTPRKGVSIARPPAARWVVQGGLRAGRPRSRHGRKT